jgi:SMI1 / KNR4 family (SUKH-1)
MDVKEIQATIERIATRSPLPKELQYSVWRNSKREMHRSTDKIAQLWTYGKVCTRRQIEAAENKLGAPLPEGVREFYRRVGNGGPGPGGGILSLEDALTVTPRLDKSFPHKHRWSNQALSDQALHADIDAGRGSAGIETAELANNAYDQAKFPGGAFVIARDLGRDFLVVANGPEMGNVWCNGINDIAPLCGSLKSPWEVNHDSTSNRMNFENWFNAWLLYADKRSQASQTDQL